MITVTEIYDDDGKLIGKVANSDIKPLFTWTEFAIGIIGAVVSLWVMAV